VLGSPVAQSAYLITWYPPCWWLWLVAEYFPNFSWNNSWPTALLLSSAFLFNKNRKRWVIRQAIHLAVDLAMVPGTVYLQDCVWNHLSKLYTLDLATGKATFIGEIINRSLWYYLCWFTTVWYRSSTSSIKCSLLLTSHHWKKRKMLRFITKIPIIYPSR